jgi:hypothetical protein
MLQGFDLEFLAVHHRLKQRLPFLDRPLRGLHQGGIALAQRCRVCSLAAQHIVNAKN